MAYILASGPVLYAQNVRRSSGLVVTTSLVYPLRFLSKHEFSTGFRSGKRKNLTITFKSPEELASR